MENKRIEKIEADIEEHRRALKNLELELENAKKEPPEYNLARELHKLNCTANHTDGCGWYYEVHNKVDNWHGNTHAEYLARAQILLNYCKHNDVSVEKAITIFRVVRGS